MSKQIYAVRDAAIEAYGQPFFVRARGEALRSFIDECQNTETQFHKHPGDYDLYYLGEYDEITGQIKATAEPERAARAVDFVNK